MSISEQASRHLDVTKRASILGLQTHERVWYTSAVCARPEYTFHGPRRIEPMHFVIPPFCIHPSDQLSLLFCSSCLGATVPLQGGDNEGPSTTEMYIMPRLGPFALGECCPYEHRLSAYWIPPGQWPPQHWPSLGSGTSRSRERQFAQHVGTRSMRMIRCCEAFVRKGCSGNCHLAALLALDQTHFSDFLSNLGLEVSPDGHLWQLDSGLGAFTAMTMHH